MPKVVYTLEAVRARLKAKGSKVAIQRRGKGALSLVATLPPKPMSKRISPHQQRIPLGLNLPDLPKNNPGSTLAKARAQIVKKAESKAEALNNELIYNTFDWADYGVRGTTQGTTTAQLIQLFKADYLSKNTLQDRTWARNWQRNLNFLPQDASLSEDAFYHAIRFSSTR
ncbi:MAG: hypothetical protein AAF197_09155, partial [Pseudomonadota bacterium]